MPGEPAETLATSVLLSGTRWTLLGGSKPWQVRDKHTMQTEFTWVFFGAKGRKPRKGRGEARRERMRAQRGIVGREKREGEGKRERGAERQRTRERNRCGERQRAKKRETAA